jgi:hypothetical protein
VYATQQDNTSISVPSQTEWGMITLGDTTLPGTGESGFIAVHPNDPNIVYIGAVGSSPGGNGALQRYDHNTRQMKLINVWPEESTGLAPRDLKYRFAWTFPIIFSPHDVGTIYVGGNHVFRTRDEGMSWDCISPDLSRNDIEKLDFSGGPLTRDSAGAEQYASCASVVESTYRKGELWASTDDGLVHVTRDEGKNWENVTPKDMPEWAYIGNVEISLHDPDTIYISATRFKLSDYKPYLFKSSDSGKTWSSISESLPQDEITRVIRVDTKQPKLLFVGTETGIFVSNDDGDTWDRMKGKFPVVPVYDLKIKDDDLVVATHGRSFWILDDISPLRLVSSDSSSVGLIAPRATIRQNIHWSVGIFNGDGKDYSPAFGVSGASYLTELPNGKKERKYLDTGENPPLGAILYYWLDKKSSGKDVKILVKNRSGQVVANCDSSNKKAAENRKPSSDEGLNRFVWDLTEDGPISLDNSLKVKKYEPFSKDSGGPAGAKVEPGQYQIILSIDGNTTDHSLEVLCDPRIEVSEEDFALQHNLYTSVAAKLSELHIAVNRIRLMKQQLQNMHKIIPDESKTVDSLVEKLDMIEGQLIDTKRETPRDVLRHAAGFDDTLINLLWVIKIADAKPPSQTKEVTEDVFSKVDRILKNLEDLISNDISDFNVLIAKASPPAISASSVGAPKTGW